MKVAITSTGLNLRSDVSLVFGRSPHFIIADIKDNEIGEVLPIENPRKQGFRVVKNYEIFNNPAKSERGAGNLAAQFIVDQGVEALILGELGNVAFGILRNAGIKMYKINPGNVETNLKQFREDKLEEITSASSGFPGTRGRGQGRSGMGRRR